MIQNGSVFALKLATRSISPTTTLSKGNNMSTPYTQEYDASASIPTKMVATTSPPIGKDVTNKTT